MSNPKPMMVTLHSGFTLHTQILDLHAEYGVWTADCRVNIISLGSSYMPSE